MAEGRTVTLATKVAPSMLAAVDEARGMLSRSAWLAMLIEAAVTDPGTNAGNVGFEVVADPAAFARNEVVVRPKIPEKSEGKPPAGGIEGEQSSPDRTACQHPRSKRKVWSWGATCEACGLRLP